MSMPNMTEVKCPGCGKEYQATTFDSINTEWPDATEDIISGKLFKAVCPECSYEAHLIYPILYNDMEHNVMIQYTPKEQLEDTISAIESLGEFKSVLFSKESDCLFNGYRVVTSQAELREKAAIFKEGLDDRFLEIYKFLLLGNIKEELEGKELKGVFFNTIDGKPLIEIYVDDDTLFSEMDMELYKKLENIPEMQKIVKEAKNTYIIDMDWAYKALYEGIDITNTED